MRATSPLLVLLALGASGCHALREGPGSADSRPPNVVLIFTDDQGWADVGVQGARGFATPNLDRLAREGVRFTDFYVAQPVCSASRAALLTGCYPNRIGIAGALGPDSRVALNPEETTLAGLLRDRGYATAIFGKWHLGHRPEHLPTCYGFDRFYGLPYSNDMWPRHPETPEAYPDLPTLEDERIVGLNLDPDGLTRELTDRAVEFIREQRGRPFFLYLPYPMPHVPLAVSAPFRGRSARGAYGDVIEELDASVGRVLAALDAHDLARDTLVLFTSDNGPWLSYGDHAGSAGPLREGKGTTFEGGVRVPFLARWPGRIPAGGVCREPAMTIDLLPTIARFSGADPPARSIDGRDVSALLMGEAGARSPHAAYFFYYGNGVLEAVRSESWKLHFPHPYRTMRGREPGRGGQPGQYDYAPTTRLELYDLRNDLGEAHDVADQHPDVVQRLQRLADGMRAELGDRRIGIAAAAAREPARVP